MNLLEDKTYKRFFCSGIDDEEAVKEGVIYYASQKVYDRLRDKDWYKIPNNKLLEQIINEALPKYRQFYRFIILNNNYKSCEFDVDNSQLVQEMEMKIDFWLNNKRKIERKNQETGKTEIIEIDRMINTKAGIFFTREEVEELNFNQMPYKYGWNQPGEVAWTRQIYDILERLGNIESTNIVQYYDYWIHTKLQRVINKKPSDASEIAYVQKDCEEFEKRKQAIEAKQSNKQKEQ